MDDDDDNMESNFAQVQREEFISKKLGKLAANPLIRFGITFSICLRCRITRGSGGHAYGGIA